MPGLFKQPFWKLVQPEPHGLFVGWMHNNELLPTESEARPLSKLPAVLWNLGTHRTSCRALGSSGQLPCLPEPPCSIEVASSIRQSGVQQRSAALHTFLQHTSHQHLNTRASACLEASVHLDLLQS